MEILRLWPLVAGLIAVIWGFYKFSYKDKLRKKHETSHLIIKSKMKKLGEKDDLSTIKISVDIINKSKTKMYILADYINVFGVKMKKIELDSEDYKNLTETSIQSGTFALIPRHVKIKKKIVAFCGKIFDYRDYWWLEPGEKLQTERMVFVPKSFDYVRLDSYVYYSTNKDWLTLDIQPSSDESGLNHIARLNHSKYKGEVFDWHNKKHKKKHKEYKNAEISNTALLFLE